MKKALLYILMCLIWGTTWMAIKIGLNDLNPFFSLGMRYLSAGIFMLFYIMIAYRKIELDRKDFKLIVYITMFNFILPYSLVYWGAQFIFSDLTSVIFASLPINVSILSFIFLKEEKFSFNDILGILIGFTGIIIIFSESLFQNTEFHFYGMLAVYFAAFSQAVITIILKKYKRGYHPLKINLFPILVTGIIITAHSLLLEDFSKNSFTLPAIVSVGYLSIFGTVIAFAIYFWLVHQIKLSILSAMAFVLPIIAIVAGWIFLNEVLTKAQLVGSALVIGGIFLTNVKIKKREKFFDKKSILNR